MIPVLALFGFLSAPAACRFERHAGPPPADLCTAWAKDTRFEPGIAPESTDCTLMGAKPVPAKADPSLVTFEAEMHMPGRPYFRVLVLAVLAADHWDTQPLAYAYDSEQPWAGAHVGLTRLEVVAPGLVAIEVETGVASGVETSDPPNAILTFHDGRGLGVLERAPNGPRWLGAAQLLDAHRTGPNEGDALETTTRREARPVLDAAARTLALTPVAGAPLGPAAPRPLTQTKHRCPIQLPLPGRFD
jgi:hypothetical protein